MIGKTISHYKILEKLGEGGLGVVYKAEDTKLRRTVALKFLKPEVLGSEEQRVRFEHEAQAAAALNHPNICTIYEIAEAEAQSFISMAYIEGMGLDEKIRKGPLPLEEAVEIAIQVGEGLQAAHEKGIVHRDIKSGIVRLTSRGTAKILDFGLARLPGQTVVTRDGTTHGTVAYMSPEQAQGKALDHRTDIWSFGVLLYEMVTGRLPFKGEDINTVIYSILNSRPEPLTALRTGVPMELERTVLKALSKKAGDRYQHMDEVLVDLHRVKEQLERAGAAALRMTTSWADVTGVSLLKDLVRRRVPQILGSYLLAGWAVIAVMTWLVDRYPLSPKIPQFCLVFLASMVPTVLLISYFHGRPGRHKWRNLEKIGVPVNAVASIGLVLLLFYGQPLATMTTVMITNDQGQTIEREIPRSEFRKSVAIFYFENELGDTSSDWMACGIPQMLEYDLSQDIYLRLGADFAQQLKRAGVAEGASVAMPLKRKIADGLHYEYFLAGSFRASPETVMVRTELYETKRAKRVAKHTVSGPDIFKLVDSLSVQLKHALGVPSYHIERTTDLPVAEIFTDKPAAARAYSRGSHESFWNNDYEAAARHLRRAVEIDSTFAMAQALRVPICMNLNYPAEAGRAMNAAMAYAYKLTEKNRFSLRECYHLLSEDMGAVLEVIKSWVQLYPECVEAHEELARFYDSPFNEVEAAISEKKIILELDPGRYDQLLEIADLYRRSSEYEQALNYLEAYAERVPGDYKSMLSIGDLHQAMGAYNEARRCFERVRALEPAEPSILMRLGDLEVKLGDFEEALRQFNNALGAAEDSDDRMNIYHSLRELYRLTGQIDKALETNEQCAAEGEKVAGLVPAMWVRGMASELYGMAGREEAGLKLVEDLETALAETPLYRILPTMARFVLYLSADDPAKVDRYEKALRELEAVAEDVQIVSWLGVWIPLAHAEITEYKGHYEDAIEQYEECLKQGPAVQDPIRDRLEISLRMARCCSKMGKLKAAEKCLLESLPVEPFEPKVHHRLALVYYDMGEKEKAMGHLQTALEVWKDADPDFKPAIEAREELARWESKST